MHRSAANAPITSEQKSEMRNLPNKWAMTVRVCNEYPLKKGPKEVLPLFGKTDGIAFVSLSNKMALSCMMKVAFY